MGGEEGRYDEFAITATSQKSRNQSSSSSCCSQGTRGGEKGLGEIETRAGRQQTMTRVGEGYQIDWGRGQRHRYPSLPLLPFPGARQSAPSQRAWEEDARRPHNLSRHAARPACKYGDCGIIVPQNLTATQKYTESYIKTARANKSATHRKHRKVTNVVGQRFLRQYFHD